MTFVDHPPIANDDNITVYQNTSTPIDSLANDYDEDNGIQLIHPNLNISMTFTDVLTIVAINNATEVSSTISVSSGTVTVTNNTIVYTPATGFVGNDIPIHFYCFIILFDLSYIRSSTQ